VVTPCLLGRFLHIGSTSIASQEAWNQLIDLSQGTLSSKGTQFG